MAGAGLIDKQMLLTAFVRHKVKGSSKAMLARVRTLEQGLLDRLQEEAPDAGDGQWQSLSLRHLNQRLCDDGLASNPESLRGLLQSLAQDGRGLAGCRGSLDLRYAGQDRFRVKLQRDWPALRGTAERRQAVAQRVLAAILDPIPDGTPTSAELLVEFAAEDILAVLRRDLALAAQLKDSLAALDRALMFLHEQRIITLQKGLAVFRQAMTIRVFPDQKGRRYSKGDYEPLSRHYRERVFQVHVMNEYARRGLEKIGQALALVVAYFSQDKADFVERYFADRQELLERATGQKSGMVQKSRI
jgi:ATP-dependent DNA helicase RecQ